MSNLGDEQRFEGYERATAGLPAPLAVVDLDAFDANAEALVQRSLGVPIRVATKSVRCRALIDRALRRPGFAGLLAFSLPEALWLAGGSTGPAAASLPDSVAEILVAYPCLDRAALRALAGDADARSRIALVIDAPEHLALIEAVARESDAEGPVQVWLDVDASLRVGPAHLGARRSPLHAVDDVVAAARAVAGSPHTRLGALMCYDAQIAGLADTGLAVHLMQRVSTAELARRRARIVEAVRAVTPVPAVNAGGTGSLHLMGRAPEVSELAAGSGLFGPTLFDGYRAFQPRPAACFALDVVRHPAPGFVTAFSGGYCASGQAGPSRLPTPCWPPGLDLLSTEGAGEVQTPLRVTSGRAPAIGSRVWLRHAKAGELLERFAQVSLVRGDEVVEAVPSYRGEGMCFG
ncbi:D-serine deaminase-like pyridoxal phosphate-dependent protein [Kineosphaera limosa]|uniref:Alanine racemase N-terminal domain-containing protein n=1 Tax=Kineosphaera limosa NBRC 100340 TaxID=1184609 RepID=K6WN26_9MICO|nr:alanine racemase [Kineosphaera limosa]NYE01476.1 D-serine deaminase-like pyridoxal phosphate-dependent protein [Kineosphaera limosa]GAB95221.1 hypothetical protein KILIM_017_00660 [Kineosphaera limosa NBRC 100340]